MWRSESRIFELAHEAELGRLRLFLRKLDATDRHAWVDDGDSSDGVTALMKLAVQGNALGCRMIVDFGCNLDKRDRNGRTALWWAARCGRAPIVDMLVEAGARLNGHNSANNCDLVCVAIRSADHQTLLSVLSAGGSMRPCSRCKYPRIVRAGVCGNVDAARTLVERGERPDASCPDGATALHAAAQGNFVDMAAYLIHAGANTEPRARGKGWTPLAAAANYDSPEVLQLLLSAGAEVDARDNVLATPLMWAVIENSTQCTNLLIQAGANVAARDKCRTTPMILAAYKGRRACAEILIAAGASGRLRDDTGTALENAKEAGRIAQFIDILPIADRRDAWRETVVQTYTQLAVLRLRAQNTGKTLDTLDTLGTLLRVMKRTQT